MRLLRQVVHGTSHAIEEKRFGLLLTPVAVRCSYQLFRLGHRQRCIQAGVYRLQAFAQPDIEEIRKVCIANVVIVRRISRNHFCYAHSLRLCICLDNETLTAMI